MKKFLSVVFMALCGITAIHAGNPQTDSKEGVECDASVTMTAEPKPHYHFTKWVMTDNNNNPHEYTVGSGEGYTCTTDDNTRINTLVITLSSSMIDNAQIIDNAQNKEITFEAIFEEDDKYGITIIAVDEDGNRLGAGDYDIVTTNIPDNYAGEHVNLTVANKQNSCYEFNHWETSTGESIGTDMTLINATYGSGPTTYYAVYKKKKVKVTVRSADEDKGTVTVSLTNQQ